MCNYQGSQYHTSIGCTEKIYHIGHQIGIGTLPKSTEKKNTRLY